MKRIEYWGALMAGALLATSGMAQNVTVGTTVSPTVSVVTASGSGDAGATVAAFRNYLVAQADADSQDAVKVQIDRAQQDSKRAGEQIQQAAEQIQRDNAALARNQPDAEPFGEIISDFAGNGGGGFTFAGARRAERALVIRSSDADSKTFAGAEEDLNIMGRILEKALSESSDEENHEAMGVRLITLGNGGSPKNLLIDGYGAIFMLNVDFPLIGSSSTNDEKSDKDSNTTWEQTKRELYGHPSGHGTGPKIQYDAARVEKLKTSLLTALKNASNIRSLKSDENVTLVVTSMSGGQGQGMVFQEKLKKLTGSGGGSGGGSSGSGGGGFGGTGPNAQSPVIRFSRNTSAGTETVLTIRARKSDIDAFAKGKLTLEEFRNKAATLIY